MFLEILSVWQSVLFLAIMIVLMLGTDICEVLSYAEHYAKWFVYLGLVQLSLLKMGYYYYFIQV